MATREIIVSRTGEARAIYDPRTHQLLSALGQPEIRRASHVEPTAELSDQAVELLLRQRQPPLDQYPADLVTTPYLLQGLRQRLPQAWWADCSPSAGPVLGPFADRYTALQEETKWLQANHIPTCRKCADAPRPPLSVLCSCGLYCRPGYLLCPSCVERDNLERATQIESPVVYRPQIEPITQPVLTEKDLHG